VLQQNTGALDSGTWSNVTEPVLDDTPNNVVTQPAKYYWTHAEAWQFREIHGSSEP